MKPANFNKYRLFASVCVVGYLLSGATVMAAEFEDSQACLDERIEENKPVAGCVKQAQAVCLSFEAPSLTGADCYRKAKEHWGALISARMDKIREHASEEVAAIAGIEVKYDLKGNLLQCDRMEDLSLVRKDPDDETVYTRMRCEATAVGLAYAKLYYQSSGME